MRLIDFVYRSTLGLKVIKKKVGRTRTVPESGPEGKGVMLGEQTVCG